MSVSRPSLKILLCMFMEGGTCSLGRFDFDSADGPLHGAANDGAVFNCVVSRPQHSSPPNHKRHSRRSSLHTPFSLHTFIPSAPNRSPSDKPLTLTHIVISQLPLHRSTPT